ncbi:Calx-beta domain-containing protein [Leptolyngbya sp. O-77]|uniref:Calx-beta domain-containing protein n=1 Tax=Leptolyngbya sp. O-77 TaxID=1080068 RepID=UPI00074D3197|nr:Calx-beta domain-containing protein [Leptolyngbya sp. O-77]BAU41656.1 Poly(beta-D-mannuronate) C5 epimerase 5 [Leptolyngbya sp. O-77]
MSVIKAGEELRIAPNSVSNQFSPVVDVDRDGNFTIAWEEFLNNRKSVHARRFQKDGTPLGNPLSVFDYAEQPAIVLRPDGQIAIAQTFQNQKTNSADILVSQIGVAGERPPGFFAVERSGTQDDAAIAIRPDSSYVVAWVSNGQDGSGTGIYARLFNADGTPARTEFLVNVTTQKDQFNPAIAVDKAGNFVITWSSFEQDGSNYGVYARRFNAAGQALSAEIPVNQTTVGQQDQATISMDAAGNFVVVWDCGVKGIVARRFNAAGRPLSDEISVSSTPQANLPSLDMDAAGNFVVTWLEGDDESTAEIYVRRFSADGTPLSDVLLVNSTTEGNQSFPTVAMQPDGDFVVTWQGESKDTNKYNIYAQRFEVAAEVSFGQPIYTIGEDGAPVGAEVTITRTGNLQVASSVVLEVAGGTATNGQDYRLPNAEFVNFRPGESHKTIQIPIVQDGLVEGDETLELRLVEVAGGRSLLRGNTQTTVTILDDDQPMGGEPGNPPGGTPPGGDRPNTRPPGGNRPVPQPGLPSVDDPSLPPVPGLRTLRGSNRKDTLTGTNAGEMLVGLRGNDRINARGGHDILIGVNPNTRTPGRNEIDQLTGGGGRDLFVLGDRQRVYYNDGNRSRAGLQDYALIKDFNRKQDAIQLHGKASDYRLGASPTGKGTAIFLETGKTDELIAVVQGGSRLNLNSSSFQFV